MSEYNILSNTEVDNTELVELIERGLRKGYWDKALIPELKKRFKEYEKQKKLLELYKELTLILNDLIIKDLSDLALSGGYYKQKILKIKNEIKELENNEN